LVTVVSQEVVAMRRSAVPAMRIFSITSLPVVSG
jgi:hypothetical protein